MLISKWGESLGVRLPRALVDDLGLRAGDDLEIVAATTTRLEVRKDARRTDAVARMRARGLRFPAGYAFDRDEANAR